MADDARVMLLQGREVQVRWRINRRARRIGLRIDPAGDGVQVTLPARASQKAGLAFLEAQAGWVLNSLDSLPRRVPFVPGTELPLLGRILTLSHIPEARRGVWREEDRLLVSGDSAHFPRRVADWLRGEARREITARVTGKAALLAAQDRPGRPVRRVSVRDTRTRWGSCSPSGDLSFSWRLLLAPPDVLDYVVAHEVAHLAEMNHGPRFWALCEALAEETKGPRRWLRKHGSSLHRYG
ncbi:MAG: SprT family zinc-dependent metalloprotease [Acetobacterales bacterium]